MISRLSIFLCLVGVLSAQPEENIEDLPLSKSVPKTLLQLMETEVSTVNKHRESLMRTDAAVTVITQEELLALGVRHLSEALDIVPGMGTRRLDNLETAFRARNQYSRFNSSVRLLVDGRNSGPGFLQGRNWNVMNIPIEEISRLEIIRGPAGMLWGANSGNGLINIITIPPNENDKSELAGHIDHHGSIRGYIAQSFESFDDLHSRIYAQAKHIPASDDSQAGNPNDEGERFRFSWENAWVPQPSDVIRFGISGANLDAGYEGILSQLRPPYQRNDRTTGNEKVYSVHLDWEHTFDADTTSNLRLYGVRYEISTGYLGAESDIFDAEWSYHDRLWDRHWLNVGLGLRSDNSKAKGSPVIRFNDQNTDIQSITGFIQDQIELVPDRWRLTLGTQLDYSDDELDWQPAVRLLYTPNENLTLWGAVSRTFASEDQVSQNSEILADVFPPGAQGPGSPPTAIYTVGGTDKIFEQISFEAGLRTILDEKWFLDATAFQNDIDNFISNEPISTELIPGFGARIDLERNNRYEGTSRGIEIALSHALRPNFNWGGDLSFIDYDLEPKSSSNDTTTEGIEDVVPTIQGSLHCTYLLGPKLTLNGFLTHSSGFGSDSLEDLTDLRVRASYAIRPNWNIDLHATNLLTDGDYEYIDRGFPWTVATPNKTTLYLYSSFRF